MTEKIAKIIAVLKEKNQEYALLNLPKYFVKYPDEKNTKQICSILSDYDFIYFKTLRKGIHGLRGTIV